jgi:hypothetical protein
VLWNVGFAMNLTPDIGMRAIRRSDQRRCALIKHVSEAVLPRTRDGRLPR